MSDEINLPGGLLPRERHYQVQCKSRLEPFFFIATLSLTVYFVWWLTWRVGTRLVSPPGIEDIFAVVALLAIGRTWWVNRIVVSALMEYCDAVALLECGRIAEAESKLEALCRRVSRRSPYHALFVLYRGLAFLRAGKPDRALTLFAAVLDGGSFEKPRHSFHIYYPVLLTAIALAHAVKGDTETAERWQGLAHDQVTPARAGLLLPLDLYLGIRAGRYEIVVKDAEAIWADAAGCLPGSQIQALRVLCAFGLSCANRNGTYDDRIRCFLDGARPCRPGQLDYLALKWPELRAFLEANDLSAKLESGRNS